MSRQMIACCLGLLGVAGCEPLVVEMPASLRGQIAHGGFCPPPAPLDEQEVPEPGVPLWHRVAFGAPRCGQPLSVVAYQDVASVFPEETTFTSLRVHVDVETRREAGRCHVEISTRTEQGKDGVWHPYEGAPARVSACVAVHAARPEALGGLDAQLHSLALASSGEPVLALEEVPVPVLGSERCSFDGAPVVDVDGYTGGYELALSLPLAEWPRLFSHTEPASLEVGLRVYEP